MKTKTVFALVLFLILPFSKMALAANNYPIILVGGWMSWSAEEMHDFNYWGGWTDLAQYLRNQGHEVYVADIGPISSNWDRACELYAFIKGGGVDYGKAHSTIFEHIQKPTTRTYPGVFPQWGEINPVSGKPNKVHLLGHSMGGPTIRTLAQLLENGDISEINLAASDPTYTAAPLFSGTHTTKNWISSITTISSNHDGNSFVQATGGLLALTDQIFALLAAVLGQNEFPFFDFKLDQWGLQRLPGETFNEYFQRVTQSSIWSGSLDMSSYDLGPQGSADLNSWVHAQSNIYYFSYATECTRKSLFTPYHVPELAMRPILRPIARIIGKYSDDPQPGSPIVIDQSWYQNDGMVSTASMDGPTFDADDIIVNYSGGAFQTGRWHFMGVLEHTDHYDVLGINEYFFYFSPISTLLWYRDLASMLTNLPQ
jgi:triacylglycerol lipase